VDLGRGAQAYQSTQQGEREALAIAYLPLLRQLSRRYRSLLPPGAAEEGEVLSWGALGLMRALHTYDPSLGVPLEAYVRRCVRHAVLEGLRSADRLPRRAREKEKRLRETVAHLEQTLQREPEEEELAQALGGWDSLREHQRAAAFASLLSLDEPVGEGEEDRLSFMADPTQEGPEEALLRAERRQRLREALARLSERERKVLWGVYGMDATLTEVAQAMGLSVSYVARLHHRAILRLRGMMGRYMWGRPSGRYAAKGGQRGGA
jgi:RNA polymerase sigma factor for flagellar operon FliA